MYKNNSRFSSKLMGRSLLKLSCNLTEIKPAIGYYYYTLLAVIRKMKKQFLFS
jgi:hypothetical protein